MNALKYYLNINDSRVVSIHCRKYENCGINNEAMLLSIDALGGDPSVYKLDVAANQLI